MDWEMDLKPLHSTVDLNVGEERLVELPDGRRTTVKLVSLRETRDKVRGAVRKAVGTIEVDGTPLKLESGNYRLPVTVGGVQVDCPVTGGYVGNSRRNAWGLEAAARLRLWPAGSSWVEPGTFAYPLQQRWFASDTQMCNEPVFVDGPENAVAKSIYYHEGLDFGGCEGMAESMAAADALVVSVGEERLPGHEDSPVSPRYDVVYLLDRRGWYHRHSHLHSIDPAVKPGATVAMGQRVGVLGKEGSSGGWSHLHFDVTRRQPSGAWGSEYGYPFIWQAYLAERSPELIAVARPHHFIWAGQKVTLDASRSWSAEGLKLRYEWSFADGTKGRGPRVSRAYPKCGIFSEIVKVSDARGHVGYDFAVVQVANPEDPANSASGIHAAYAPTFDIRPGQDVTFKVRSFGTQHGEEVWDFGDGSDPVAVRSDGNANRHDPAGYAVATHSFGEPGDYLVSVRRTNERGFESTARLHVRVEGR
jgi:hypothetical protein